MSRIVPSSNKNIFNNINKNGKKKSSNDRFIPRRSEVNFNLEPVQAWNSSYDIIKEKPNCDAGCFVNMSQVRYRTANYRNMLRSMLVPLDQKILNFFQPKKYEPERLACKNQKLWPVKPRKKPLIGPPSLIFDLPHFDSNICHHFTDWSSTNSLATIFENEVHVWNPVFNSPQTVTSTRGRVKNSLKWSPDGTKLAVALIPSQIGCWHLDTQKVTEGVTCYVLVCCSVLCIEWLNNNDFVTGCSNGHLALINSFKLDMKVNINHAHGSAIINMQASCEKRYLATCSTDRTVKVWSLPNMEPKLSIKTQSIVKTLAWHPWKDYILVFGHTQPYGIVIWNILKKKMFTEQSIYKYCEIDSLTFSPKTGELVAGMSVFEKEDHSGIPRNVIAVFEDLKTVVEELHLHEGAITCLLWGNGGNTLASASADENLCMWEFFGPANKKPHNESRGSESKILKLYSGIR